MNYTQLHSALKSTYQDNKTADKMLKKQGYTLDKQLSGKRAKVFVDENGQAYVAHKGTQSIQDVFTDIGYAFGKRGSKRLDHAKKVRKQAEEKYGVVNSLGHSLGGHLAERSGNTQGKVITYNKASNGYKQNNPNQIDIRQSLDIPVSFLTPKNKNNVTLRSKSLNPLKEHKTDSLLGHKNKIVYI